ncbi:hypothetical protein EBT31_11105 [bacterium]|jgi:hypothetical protein|nr:hypothetical protein [bacterium]
MTPLLKSILEIESESGMCDYMQAFLIAFAEQMQWECRIDKIGNIYMQRGSAETYPCVVAHIDTVHSVLPPGHALMAAEVKPGVVTGFDAATMEQSGIGGDDKCGIYAALRAMIATPACKAAFFVDEEVGCIGSGRADIGFFSNCRFILQADRRGGSDWVRDIQGPLGSDEFQAAVAPYLKAYGYSPTSGAMSDVMALRDNNVGVSCANMSAGYHNPHQSSEWIDIQQLENCVAMITAMCLGLQQSFPFTMEQRHEAAYDIKWNWHGDWGNNSRSSTDKKRGRRRNGSRSSKDSLVLCDRCEREPAQELTNDGEYLCEYCSAAEMESEDSGICDSCRATGVLRYIDPFGNLCDSCHTDASEYLGIDNGWSGQQ